MDCRTARLFLHLSRPGTDDLAEDEAKELTSHLEHCMECNALSRAERRLDQHIGRAMRAVEVPEGLRTQILYRVAAERGDLNRRRFARVARIFGAVAALALVVVGVVWWYTRPAEQLAAENIVYAFNVTPPGAAEDANKPLKALGTWGAPEDVNYAYLTGTPALAILPGYEREKVKVPQLVFTRLSVRRDGSSSEQKAIIFVLDNKQFKITDPENSTNGYRYRLEVHKEDRHSNYTYLVLYTGDTWDWLKAPRREEE